MKDFRTAFAQAMRLERLGGSRFSWDTLDSLAQEDARRRVDFIIRLLADEGYAITRVGDPKPLPTSPASADIYSLISHAVETERIIRRVDDDWQLVGRSRRDRSEKILLTTTLAQTDIDADVVLSGNPDGQKLQAIGTRLAMSTLIRKLHGDTRAPE